MNVDSVTILPEKREITHNHSKEICGTSFHQRSGVQATPMRFARELDVVRNLALKCGQLALDVRAQGSSALAASDKPDDQGLVTAADTAINRIIVETLSNAFPNDAIVAEETTEDVCPGVAITRDRCWFIDPIDGTRDYADGDPGWAVQIGLCEAGQVAFGLIFEPTVQRLSWGGRALGSTTQVVGEQPQALTSGVRGLDALQLVSSKNHSSPRTLEVMQTLGIPPERNLRIGSVGVKISTIARGDADVYIHPRSGTKSWDTCAPQAILEGVGGTMSDLAGRPLRYDGRDLVNRGGLLACRGHHGAIVEKIAELTHAWFPGAE